MEIPTMGIVFLPIIGFILLLLKIILVNPKGEKNYIPTNWPVLGMLPGFILNCLRVQDYVTEVLIQSGGTFLFIGPWFTNMSTLVTSDVANVRHILSKNVHNFVQGPDLKKILDILGEGIINVESDVWERQRKTAFAILRGTSFEESIANTSWKKVQECLIPVLDLVSETRMEIDIQKVIQRFSFQCTSVLVLGHDPTAPTGSDHSLKLRVPNEKDFADADVAILQRYIFPKAYWMAQSWLQVGKERMLSKAKENIGNFVSDCIAFKLRNRKGLDKNEGYSDILTSYMRRVIEEKGDVTNNKILKDDIMSFMFAGKDTISATLSWFFWLLATNPEEQKKIRQEMLENTSSVDGKWKFSNLEEVKNLTYLHGALCETLRLFPPIAMQHKTPVKPDRLPSGHWVGPKMRTVIPMYSMGRMESIWGKDCLDFKPERWISENGGVKNEPGYKFIAFGAGPRLCLGKDLALIQMKIVASAIVSRFHVELAEGNVIAPSSSIVIHMKHGLKVRVSKCV